LLSDHLGLANERVQNAVFLALVIEEIAARHGLRGLKLAVDTSIALLKARRVPRQVNMDEIMAACLQVEAFARRIGAYEDADGLLLEGCIEGDLDSVALFQAGLSCEVEDPSVQLDTANAALKQTFLDPLDQPATRVFPLGEQNEPPVPPNVVSVQHLVLDPVKDCLDTGIGQVPHGGADREHPIHMGDRRPQIAEFTFGLMGRNLDSVVVVEQFRFSLGRRRIVVLALLHQTLPMGCQCPVESSDRGEKALLQIREQKARAGAARR
jgi:hypothetical protein